MDTGANQSELGSMYRFIVNSMVAEAAEMAAFYEEALAFGLQPC